MDTIAHIDTVAADTLQRVPARIRARIRERAKQKRSAEPLSIPLHALKRPVAYHRVFRAVSGSTVAAVFLSQAWYWTQKLSDCRDGWFYKTQAEWEEETGLSRREQNTARKHLTESGILEQERCDAPAQLWYRIDQRQLARLIQRAIKIGGTVQTGVAEPGNQECAKAPISHTESTAESTTHIEPAKEFQRATQSSDPLAGFDEFWQAYPRKERRAAARAAWRKLSPDAELARRMIDAVKRQAETEQWRKEGGRFIPGPVKWLEEERWQDEPGPSGKTVREPEPLDIVAYLESVYLDLTPDQLARIEAGERPEDVMNDTQREWVHRALSRRSMIRSSPNFV